MSNRFADAADLFVRYTDWEARVAKEVPFLARVFTEHGAKKVLETACGVAMHSRALTKLGFDALATDIDEHLLALARAQAEDCGETLCCRRASLLSLADDLADCAPFDAALCVGNSLSTLPCEDDVYRALSQMRAVLRTGGVAFIHLVDLERALRTGADRAAPLRIVRAGDEERLLLRFFAPGAEGNAQVRFVELRQAPGKPVEMIAQSSSPLLVLSRHRLEERLPELGFQVLSRHTGATEQPYDAARSPSFGLLLRAGG